jgi:hypothetical protein
VTYLPSTDEPIYRVIPMPWYKDEVAVLRPSPFAAAASWIAPLLPSLMQRKQSVSRAKADSKHSRLSSVSLFVLEVVGRQK